MRGDTLAVLFGAALAAGCGGGGGGSDDDPAPQAVAGASTGTSTGYANGHPLTLSTTDAAVLAREAEVHTLVNDHRVALGKNALIDAGNVDDVARGHSRHMIVHSFFDHVNPELDTPGARLDRAGIGWSFAGENIAAGFATARDAYEGWIRSPGHLANIERDGWTHSGIGYSYDDASTYKHYWTQNFIQQ